MTKHNSGISRRSILQAAAAFPLLPAAARAPVKDYVLMVFTNPIPGKEAEYNDFYEHRHMPDVASVPGFVRAQRFKLAVPQLRAGSPPLPDYMVFYQITTDYLAGVFAEVDSRLTRGVTRFEPVMDRNGMAAHTFETLGPAIPHAGAVESPDWRQHFLQLVYSNPAPGMAAAYNQWYDHVHAPEVVSSPDFVSARRYKRTDVQLVPNSTTNYLAVFKISTPDFAATVRKFQAGAPHETMSKAFDGKSGGGYSYQAIGPEIRGDDIRAQHLARSGVSLDKL